MTSLNQIIQIEKWRYQQKGLFNSCLALGLLVGIMWSSVQVGSWFWPEIVEDEANFILIGSFLLHKLFQLISFGIYLPGYLDIFPQYRQYRINSKTSKPWERVNWPEVRKRAVLFVVFNQFIVYPLIMLVSAQMKLNVRFSGFPSFWELFSQVTFIYYLQDFLFYWGHRLFHENKWLYTFHKVHHQYDNLYSLMTEFFHPIDFVLGSVLPSAISVLVLGNQVHCFTLFFLVCWKVLTSTQNHSGYDFPWSPMRVLPFVSGASYHDHHHSHNTGNYAGSCYIWDLLLGTNKEYMKQWLKKD